MSQLTIKLSDKADALIAQLQKEIFNRRRKKVSAAGVVETLVESGAKSQSDKRFATSWTNLIKDIEKAADFLQDSLANLIAGKVPIDKLIITKSLRGHYKNPKQIAHKVLADRIGRRDPGNKPGPGDRIPFVYFEHENKKALQGEKIELPSFVVENDLQIDYAHYITNQVMKPIQQVFALVLERMKAFKKVKGATLRRWYKQLADLKEKHPDEETYQRRLATLRNREVKSLLFDSYLLRIKNKSNGNNTVADYFNIA